MKKGIISALITIFLLDKSSKGMDERTMRSSWFRTSVYLILTIIFAIFFYRTSQVATIINGVEIVSLRGYEDSLHNSLDTIEMVCLYNNFKTSGLYINPYVDYLKKDSSYIESGGVQIVMQMPPAAGIIKNKDSLTDERKREIENLTGVTIKPNTGSIYSIEYYARSIPSLIPTYPKMIVDTSTNNNDTRFSTIEYVGNVKKTEGFKRHFILEFKQNPAKGEFTDAICYKQTIINNHYNHYDSDQLNRVLPHSRANKLSIFSACDLSQYTYLLTLSSDMYIKNLSVAYNVPIEVVNNNNGMVVGPNSFGLFDINDTILYTLLDGPSCFNVKLPTMANLQQIRSIILTAIVSALFSLFCTNFFYRVRKMVKNRMIKRRITISEWVEQNSNNLKNSRFLLITIILVLLLFVLLIVCKGALGYTYLIGSGIDGWLSILSVILALALIIGSIYVIYKYRNGLGNFVKTLPSKIKHAKMKKTIASKIKGAKKKKLSLQR